MKRLVFNRTYVLFISLLLFRFSSYGQNMDFVDSLKDVLKSNVNDTIKINALFVLANAHYLSKPDTAILLCQEAERLSEGIQYDKGLSGAYSWLGYLLNQKGEIKNALAYNQKSLKIREKTGDKKGIATCLNNIGLIYDNQGNIAKGLEYYHKSLIIMEDIDYKRGVANILNNIAYVYTNQGDIEKALEYNNRSLKVSKEANDKEAIATALNNIGAIYRDEGNIEKGLKYFKKSIQIYVEIGDKLGEASCLHNLAVVYENQGDFDRALELHYKSLKIHKEISNNDGLTTSLYRIGGIYLDQGNASEAKKHIKNSLNLSLELGNPKMISNTSGLLSRIEKGKRNYKNALEFYELHIKMRDSINNEQTQKAALKQNMQYEYQKQHLSDSLETSKKLALKDIEIEKQMAEAKAERTTKYGLFGGLALVLVIALVLARSVKQKKKANTQILTQKKEVEIKNKEILDSITYAEKIQSAILPPTNLFKQFLPQSFIYYKPKDIVAGDFYWLESANDEVYFSAADCTGHGVPGAMMSVMCSNALTKCVKELELTKPAEILDATTKIIESRFERSEQLVLDGMDLALCKVNLNTKKLEYAGANNPLWIVRDEELLETKADKQPIGQYDDRQLYTNHNIELQTGDIIYIFSDGYVDQFGGPKGKKYKAKAFRKLLLSIRNENIEKQLVLIDDAFEA